MLLLGVSMCLTPFFPRFEYILTNQAVVGFASGGIDIATNVLIMEMWEENSNTFLQATHLCYAIGSTASPMIAAPFLLNATVYKNKTNNNETLRASVNHITIPYMITSSTAIIAFLVLVIFELCKPYNTPERSLSRKNQKKLDHNLNESAVSLPNAENAQILVEDRLPNSYYAILIALSSLILCFYLGIEMNIFNYLPSFLLNLNLNISSKQIAYMNTAFSGFYTLFRLPSMALASKLRPAMMLSISFTILIFGNVLLIIFGFHSQIMLWVTISILGAGCSCVYPAIYAFIEERIDVTNFIGGIFMFASSIITTIMPIIVGNLIKQKPAIFMYVNTSGIFIVVIIFLFLNLTDLWKKRIQSKKSK
ncbi:sodium-dependent glucose transporter 1-like protein [Dinothrombium tinctorium]|uniref:Sodium-dependent glucose transporter 1-like protein n=1 Tax=Dinothrombium tinctorium TaxID=1965070 RepID=A0A3S3NY39_9ACAR|nr:sodium-dependent glucose transporter 1-like protein [Dinothrombium tinctorium]